MTFSLARAVFAEHGHARNVHLLAEGMSSIAWVGEIDGREWVVRVPAANDARPDPGYRREASLNAALRLAGVPAADTRTVEIDGTECSIAPRLVGTPIQTHQWTDEFVADVATALAATHSVPIDGHGLTDAVSRFYLARLWPLDGSALDDHPIIERLPGDVEWIASQREEIVAESRGPSCVVHTDLHWDHLLRSTAGRLTGLLDFGDAFAGPPAWDFACLRYYHGEIVARRVADRYPGGRDVLRRSGPLGIAFALYKLDKTPDRPDVIERVAQLTNRIESG